MKLLTYIFCLGLILFSFPLADIHAQNPYVDTSSSRKDAVRLFIDCRCDMNHIRREIPYVNYVRDVREAQLYVLMTSQNAGNGGREYTLTYEGLQDFAGLNDTLQFTSMPDDTYDHIRSKQVHTLKMGLMRYVARTPMSTEINISHNESLAEEEVIDRWNNWVFELGFSPDFEGEETYREISFDNSVEIRKITEDWKLEFEFDFEYRRATYNYEDTSYIALRNGEEFNTLIVKSLGDHWSAGGFIEISASSYRNYKFQTEFIPALEYNFYPYSESTRRQLRVLYGIGYTYNIYNDTTIYDKISEGLFLHSFNAAYEVRQKWGSVDVSMQASNYLNDLAKNRIEFGGRISVRIAKGLSFRVYGSVARVRDQISLTKGELTQAEVLLRLQEVATGYYYYSGISISYTFGSIYNNIVNPRFGHY
ncbi:MAG TPA: hypothetical protein ENI20_00480 [Bacteroides sp.]|nr:hypothetical protein [Bacteroides sp.]